MSQSQGKEKSNVAARYLERIHATKASRFKEIADRPADRSPADIKLQFEQQAVDQAVMITAEEYRLLISQLKAGERSKQRFLEERRVLIADHLSSIKNSEKELLALEGRLLGFKNDASYAEEYTQRKQAADMQLNALELSLFNDPPPKRDAVQKTILEIWHAYQACYALLRQFLANLAKQPAAQQALNIDLHGAHITGSAGAKIQTLIIQTDQGLQDILLEIKQVGVLEQKIKEKDETLNQKNQQITDLEKKIAQAKQEPEAATKAQKIAADKEAAVKQAAEQGEKKGAAEAKVIADQQAEQTSKQMQQQTQQHIQEIEQVEKAAAQRATEQATKLAASQAETEQAQKAVPKYIPGPGMYNPPKAGPAPVMAADIMEEKISEQEKQTFFRHIARGEQDEAEAMLQQMPSLAFAKGRCDDISDLRCLQKGDQFQRIFQDISGWQYAIWAGDIHMCQMMKRCFTQVPNAKPLIQIAKSQYLEVLGGRGDFAPNQHGRQFDLTPLIDALTLYAKQYDSWTPQQREHQWCKVIGGLQRKLPAHVINEYCRPDRSFVVNGGPPDFLDATLPRKGWMYQNQEFGLDWLLQTIFDNGKMGVSWATHRTRTPYNLGRAVGARGNEWAELAGWAGLDAKALDSLKAQRSQQVEQLSEDLDASMGAALSPSLF